MQRHARPSLHATSKQGQRGKHHACFSIYLVYLGGGSSFTRCSESKRKKTVTSGVCSPRPRMLCYSACCKFSRSSLFFGCFRFQLQQTCAGCVCYHTHNRPEREEENTKQKKLLRPHR